MKKKMLALLVAVTLCMVLIAMPFSASAAGSASGTLGGYACNANLTMGTNSVGEAYATAKTTFATYADSIMAKVQLQWKGGFGTYWTSQYSDSREFSTYASYTISSGYTTSVALSAKGWHSISWYSYGWSPETSI